ncbi:SGNH/GDSL hydrolase family protein, partial [Methylobacterium trifolii]
EGRLDPLAVGDYSQRLRALCERLGCRFADPFAALRDGEGGFAKPGAMRDGLHLSAYRPALQALAPALCGTGSP